MSRATIYRALAAKPALAQYVAQMTVGALSTTPPSVPLPGRLGHPEYELRTDPRADPRMVAALAPYGVDERAAPAPLSPDDPIEARLAYLAEAEAAFEGLFAALMADLPPVPGITHTTETITGPDGGDLPLYIHRPEGLDGPLPGVLHIHGGGMTLLSGSGPAYVRWRDELAASRMVVIGVEFRNASGVHGNHPFPAGLDDCATALDWVHANRERLGLSKVIVSGESGGANLTLATTLRAKRDGRLHMIDGVYALVPFISGAYGWPEDQMTAQFPSLLENDGYFVVNSSNAVVASAYDPDGSHARDPLCWPYWASEDDLRGLPPHTITVDELDIFRDEGLGYYRKLVRAGVNVTARMNAGVCHAGELMFRAAMPDLYLAAVTDIRGFAERV